MANKPGGVPLIAPAGMMEGAAPGKNTQVGRSYLRDGAFCEQGPVVGACTLDKGERSRLIQLYGQRVGDQHSAFNTGASMAYTDVRLSKDDALPWYVGLALDACSAVLGKAIGGAIERFGEWSKGLPAQGYERIFGGEFVSERALAVYGAVARTPLGPVKYLADKILGAAKQGVPGATVGNADPKQAALELLKLVARQASFAFDYLTGVTPAETDDVHLLALYEAMGPNGPQFTDYQAEIEGRLAHLESTGIGRIGREYQLSAGGSQSIERGAVWVRSGTYRRLALVEHDGVLHRMQRTTMVTVPGHSRFLNWIDDPTEQEIALGLTRSRGDGNVGEVDYTTASNMLEDFSW